jgi:hypothetical protein
MCDYSLHAISSRPAEIGETLVSTRFRGTYTRGFASAAGLSVAVCVLPGTEIAFEDNVRVQGTIFRKNIGERLARFRRINADKLMQHHDALEFPSGTIVLLTDLAIGQKAIVLQLPAEAVKQRSTTKTEAGDAVFVT